VGRTGSSDPRATVYSSLLVDDGDSARAWLFRGREIPLTHVGVGALMVLRAMTLGTVTGVTSDARPTRKNREPRCITTTCEPRRPYPGQSTSIKHNHTYSQRALSDGQARCRRRRTSGGWSSVVILLRAAFRPHMLLFSDLRYDVLMCFGLSLKGQFWYGVHCVDDWDILWGHMKGRVAHPLRLIAFDVGDAPRHCIGDLKYDTLLFGGFCKVCELAAVTRWLGQNSRVALHRVVTC
jgi:hypothetical protein